MLFLLKDGQGRALLMTEAASKAEADAFGRRHLPLFCGESVEIDMASRAEAEEFWGVRTVRVVGLLLHTQPVSVPLVSERRSWSAQCGPAKTITMALTWVRGPRLPEDVAADDLLTPEDHRDLTLDHIARTSELVAQVDIFKRA